MANAQCLVMMVKIVVKKKELQKWTVAKTANAPKKAMMVKTAVRKKKVIINPLISHL